MKREILIEDIKFWVDQDIIYCKFYNGFDETFLNTDLENVFEAAITKLSDGKYRSIILNLRDIDHQLSVKVFKFLSSNALIKSLVLSKVFIVRTYNLKVLFSIYCFTKKAVLPIKIYKNFDLANKFCNEIDMEFNARN